MPSAGTNGASKCLFISALNGGSARPNRGSRQSPTVPMGFQEWETSQALGKTQHLLSELQRRVAEQVVDTNELWERAGMRVDDLARQDGVS